MQIPFKLCSSYLLIFASAMFLFNGVRPAGEARSNGHMGLPLVAFPELKQPEDTIGSFVSSFNERDFERLLKLSAHEEIAKRVDYSGLSQELGFLDPMLGYLPADSLWGQEFSQTQGASRFLKQLVWLHLSLTLPDKYAPFLNNERIFLPEAEAQERVSDFTLAVKQGQEPQIKLVKTGEMLLEGAAKRHDDDFLGRQRKIYGADEIKRMAVLVESAGQLYFGSFELYRYGDRWLLASLNSPLFSNSPNARFVKVDSEATFDKEVLRRGN